MTLAAQGGPAIVDALVRNGAGQPVDPTGLSIEIRDLVGSLIDQGAGVPPIVRIDLGHYVYTWAVPSDQALGTYTVAWTGLDPTTQETVYGTDSIEVVLAGYIQTGLTFLSQPDYEGVRQLLGVTDLDVTDDVVQSLPFGQHAELRVKTSDPDWAAVVVGSTSWNYLRMATAYGTAALIAESWAKGGMISLAHGPGTGGRTAADWDKLASLLWGYFPRLIEAAEEVAPGSVPPASEPKMYEFRLLRKSGPTAAAARDMPEDDEPPLLSWWMGGDPAFLAGVLPR